MPHTSVLTALASGRSISTPAGRFTVVMYEVRPGVVRVETRYGAGSRTVEALTKSFDSAELARRIKDVIVAGLSTDGATVNSAREAVVTYLSTLVARVDATNPNAPHVAAELLKLRAWFAAPVVEGPDVDVVWERELARALEPRTPSQARAERAWLRAVL